MKMNTGLYTKKKKKEKNRKEQIRKYINCVRNRERAQHSWLIERKFGACVSHRC